MLKDHNELLSRVGPGTRMGDFMRRFWVPALQSERLEADGRPERVRLLGEDFVAERHHLEAANLEAFLFIAGKHGADEALGDGVGLEQNECGLERHAREVGWGWVSGKTFGVR